MSFQEELKDLSSQNSNTNIHSGSQGKYMIQQADYSKLDYEEMAKAIGLEAKHVPMLLMRFVEEATVSLEKLKVAIDELNFEEIEQHSHSIKGSSSNLRLSVIAEMTKRIEQEAIAKNAEFTYNSFYTATLESVKTIKI
jgi:HPt (histidine-containing phosphotransfer) domain-containing protein